jgi:hypothetical protein
LFERAFRELNPGNDERFARSHEGPSCEMFRHRCQRRRVAAADVLGERGADGLADFCGGQCHAAKMALNGGRGKQKPGPGGSKKRLKL